MRVKIKKALLKDTFKEIKKSYKRFISILLMALLGVGFFAGLRASSPDMVDSIDTYYKNQNVYDIEVMSTLGLTDNDLEALANIENVENVYGTYSRDGLIKTNEKEIVSKILCVDNVNTPVLVEGNMPENIDECVVEKDFLEGTGKKIGDYIEIEPEKIENTGTAEGEETEYLKSKTLKIVGVVESPLYISRERGSTKLGTGVIDYYIYVNRENVNSEVYTEIYITLENRDKYQTGSKKYEDYVEETKLHLCHWFTVDDLIQMIPLNCTRLISGGAEGVDQLARQAAETLGIPLTEYLPDYETYGRRAPLVRNSQIIAEADLVLAFWDMSSHGTAHTITECIRRRIPIKVIDLKQLHS